MAKLSGKKDRERTEKAVEFGGGSIIKFESGHNFVLLLGEEYGEGHIHWVKTLKNYFRRVCAGGLEEKGWAPEICPLCRVAKDMYDNRKVAKSDGDAALAKEYLEKGNDIKSSYSATFAVIKFQTVTEKVIGKTKSGKNKAHYKPVPNFEQYEVGKLMLSYAQIKKLYAILDAEDSDGESLYPFIENGEDLTKYIIDFHKKKVGDEDKYERVATVIPLPDEIDTEDLDLAEEDIPDVLEDYEDSDDLENIAELYIGEVGEIEEEEYEEEEMEKKPPKKRTKKAAPPKRGRKKAPVDEEEYEDEDEDEEEDDDDLAF